MTTETTAHRFDAAILGKEVRGQKVSVKLDWKLPGSRYELIIYVDPADAEALNQGDRLNWSIVRESLKEGKDPKYASSYFWGWNKDDARVSVYEDQPDPEWQNMGGGFAGVVAELGSGDWQLKPEPGQSVPVRPNEGIAVEGVVQGHLEKLAVDLCISWSGGQEIQAVEIRIVRDMLFHKVKSVPIMPEGYCYHHDVGRNIDSKKRFYHKHGENYCMPGGLFNAEGEVVDDVAII